MGRDHGLPRWSAGRKGGENCAKPIQFGALSASAALGCGAGNVSTSPPPPRDSPDFALPAKLPLHRQRPSDRTSATTRAGPTCTSFPITRSADSICDALEHPRLSATSPDSTGHVLSALERQLKAYLSRPEPFASPYGAVHGAIATDFGLHQAAHRIAVLFLLLVTRTLSRPTAS